MKAIITVSVIVFGSLFGFIGTLLDHGNGFGPWTFLLSTIGSIFGIWAGYKAGKYYL